MDEAGLKHGNYAEFQSETFYDVQDQSGNKEAIFRVCDRLCDLVVRVPGC
jgi:hypothetical protein